MSAKFTLVMQCVSILDNAILLPSLDINCICNTQNCIWLIINRWVMLELPKNKPDDNTSGCITDGKYCMTLLMALFIHFFTGYEMFDLTTLQLSYPISIVKCMILDKHWPYNECISISERPVASHHFGMRWSFEEAFKQSMMASTVT